MQVVAKSVNETLLSTRVLPALVTLANDAEMSVRVATVAAFGSIVEHSTDKTVRLSHCLVHMNIVSTYTAAIYVNSCKY